MVILGEARRTVVAAIQLEQVDTLVVIIDTAKVAGGSLVIGAAVDVPLGLVTIGQRHLGIGLAIELGPVGIEVVTGIVVTVDTHHDVEVVGIVEALVPVQGSVGGPLVALAVVAPSVGVAVVHDPLGSHTAPVVTIHGVVA